MPSSSFFALAGLALFAVFMAQPASAGPNVHRRTMSQLASDSSDYSDYYSPAPETFIFYSDYSYAPGVEGDYATGSALRQQVYDYTYAPEQEAVNAALTTPYTEE